jgi:S-formylglutathione hydrolase FrmB
MNKSLSCSLRVATAVVTLLVLATGQAQAEGRLDMIRVHGASLEGNLQGNDPDRDVFVYLPSSYDTDTNRRYPVVYFLHGYGATAQAYINLMGLPGAVDEPMAGGREMILVLPDTFTLYNGSMYSNSPTIGDWEGFIADDLVSYIDANYRTIPERGSRGLSGHSMGGYGTLRIGMKHPEVFAAIYAMSSCCLMNQAPGLEAIEREMERTADGPPEGGGFANAQLAQLASWAPNPQNPPLYIDWPYQDGELQPAIAARYTANSPIVMVDQYVPSLESFRAIFLDVGDQDGLMATNVQLSEALDRLGVEHEIEIYEGDHGNRVAQRFRENVLPFFDEHLD